MQVAFDREMHELKLLMAADDKLWRLRGCVAGTASLDGPEAAPDGPAREPSWTSDQVDK